MLVSVCLILNIAAQHTAKYKKIKEIFIMQNKTEIMAQIVTLISQLIDNSAEPQAKAPAEHSEPVEMLTIKECSEAVSGLSEHTVRQLVAQKKIPYIRTGQGKRGKILISKSALLDYMKGAA